MFYGVPGTSLEFETEGWAPETYEMLPIFVERNEFLDEKNSCEHVPERVAPFYVYDCLKPCSNTVPVDENGTCAVYFSECQAVMDVKRDCEETFALSRLCSEQYPKRSMIGRLFDSLLRVFETLF